ncbi:MAG TPA: hypothetical protein DCS87_16975 [Rheinheimera sp.]|nr:hypothetical protein [Rheinheimera sp.]
MRFALFLLCITYFLFGCGSFGRKDIYISDRKPSHGINVLNVVGEIDKITPVLNVFSKNDIDEFYNSKIGTDIKKEFDLVNSNFSLTKIAIYEVKEDYFKQLIGIKKENFKTTIVFDLIYTYEAFTPSATIDNNPARARGNLSLIISELNKNYYKITVSTENFRIIDGFSCILREGIICGDTTRRLENAPFEESLILNYIKFILNKNGFKTS